MWHYLCVRSPSPSGVVALSGGHQPALGKPALRLPAHAALASAFLALLPLAGCGASHNPDTYAPRAVQQANRVEQGQIVGVRQVRIAAGGETGAAAGAAAGAD